MSIALRLAGIRISRGKRPIVDAVDAQIEEPGLVAICGPNGAGKSTLLAALAGVLPFEGSVVLDNGQPKASDLAYMPQATAVNAGLTVLETVLLGRIERLRWHITADDLDAAIAALQSLHLSHLAEARLDRLSGGQQQLVFIAQRLVRKPRLLLLDEPTSALDLNRQMILLEELLAYVATKKAIAVLAMHDLTLAARYASTVLLMRDGRLVAAGRPRDVFTPGTIFEAYGVDAELLTTSAGHSAIVPLAPARRPPHGKSG